MYNNNFDYTYQYFWVRYKSTGEILIAEKRIHHDEDEYISWELAGSDLGYEEEDFEILSRVEDYNVN